MKINGKLITPERLIEIALPRHAEQIKRHLEEASKTINPSIIDRTNETGGLVVCDWQSYRTTK